MFSMNYKAPFGDLVIESTQAGISRVSLGTTKTEKRHKHLEQAAKELNEYFLGQRKTFSVPLDIQGTDFQRKTWKALTEIPYGSKVSYLDLAKKVAGPKHCRAVANANNKNKLPIFIPCHRVIGSDGSLVGFAWGLEVKRELLENEGVEGSSTPSTHKRENTCIK